MEPLEPRIALSGVDAGDSTGKDDVLAIDALENCASQPLDLDSHVGADLALDQYSPTNISVVWWTNPVEDPDGSKGLGKSDALSFDFGSQDLAGIEKWQIIENGLPLEVNAKYYESKSADVWKTDLPPILFTSGTYKAGERDNPVILPAGYYKGPMTAGNKYEIKLFLKDGTQITSSEVKYGRFLGDVTQTGTISLLDYDTDANYSLPGVTPLRAHQGEQVAALVLDAGTKVNLEIGELGVRGAYTSELELKGAEFNVTVNRSGVVTTTLSSVVDKKCTLTIDTAVLAGNSGMVSLCISNPLLGYEKADRYLGIIVKDRDGNVPDMPETLTIGAVNENSPPGQQFFRGDTIDGGIQNPVGFQQFDSQYIYLNGGPLKKPDGSNNPAAWRTSSGGYDGKKLIQSVRESLKFGAVPTVVYYNIMCPNESQQIALDNIKNEAFMVEYFKDLKFTIETIRSAANGATVSLIIEPDFLAYMMQSARIAEGQYKDPATIEAATSAAYTAGFLPDPGAGNRLSNDLPGFIEAINRGMRYLATTTDGGRTDQPLNLEYGWKFNLWAYDMQGVPSLMKVTDGDWDAGRQKVITAATAVAEWYEKAGILTGETGQTMDFIALDKYGTDGGCTPNAQTKSGYKDPAGDAPYFYNADHWNNYLLYAKTLHTTLDDLPVRLWQIPVGHVNEPLVDGEKASVLPNLNKQWEDSAVDFFLGGAFTGRFYGNQSQGTVDRNDNDAAAEYFGTIHDDDLVKYITDGVKVERDGEGKITSITWENHLKAAQDAGIEMIMFGPGLPESTQGGGYSTSPPMDDWFWASKVKNYYAGGGLFIERPSVVLDTAEGQSATTGNTEIHFTVAFSHAISGFTAEDVTLGGTAGTIAGATIGVETIVDGIEYEVTITLKDSANTCAGDVIATIAAEELQDKDGNSNFASASTANAVRYAPNAITGQGESNVTQALEGGEPLPGVHVSLTSATPGGFAERTTTTDSNGYYEFENVPNGAYRVTVIPPVACLDTGSHTTVVSAEGSRTYEADFSFGALKASCIPNRMIVTSSLPVGSTQWHLVVQEALNLGEGTGSQVTQLGAAEAGQPAVTQYLVLAPRTASLASDAPPADKGEAVAVDAVHEQVDGGSGEITQAAVAPIVEEAITRWAEAGLDQQSLDKMQNTTFVLSDLTGWYLGMTRGSTVWLDYNAAGLGWFVDSTPDDDEEFSSALAGGLMQVVDPQALDRLDLLTVVSHELGHVAGLQDSDISDLMGPSLEMGLRLVPSAHDVALANI